MSIRDGASYAPVGLSRPVVQAGEFQFAAAFLDHGHIYGQCKGLLEAGGTLTHVYDPDPARVADFVKVFPAVRVADTFDALLEMAGLVLIASAAIPDQRAAIGQQVLRAGKHYFTDKSPFTTLTQLAETRRVVQATGLRYFVYYSERLHNEAAWHAGEMLREGAVGEVIHVLNVAPHRLSEASRPAWFFDKARYGGIITDIGSHQVEQFLSYAGCTNATVNHASVRNQSHPDLPGLEDFGELSLAGDSGASFYTRLDWYTPEGMPVWGDGRSFILGTQGSLEVRKYVDVGRQAPASVVLHADAQGVHEIDCLNKVGFPFFGQMILDILQGTENAMSQQHIFAAAEISLRAQAIADNNRAG